MCFPMVLLTFSGICICRNCTNLHKFVHLLHEFARFFASPHFFAPIRTFSWFGPPFSGPRPTFWPSLGALGRLRGALDAPRGCSWGLLGRIWVCSWTLLDDIGAPEGSLRGPGTDFRPIEGRFCTIFVNFLFHCSIDSAHAQFHATRRIWTIFVDQKWWTPLLS